MPIATFPIGPLSTNSYIINDTTEAVAIDVGGDPAPMLDYLQANKLLLAAICLTHMHFDHLYGVADLAAATGAPVLAPEGDRPIMDTESSNGGLWGMPRVKPFQTSQLPTGKTMFGDMECIVLDTPGHTPGGVSLYFPKFKAVFTGDALFYRSLGRTDFPFGNHPRLLKSIKDTLFSLPDDTEVYPGHGPATTIGSEKRENPFVGEFAY